MRAYKKRAQGTKQDRAEAEEGKAWAYWRLTCIRISASNAERSLKPGLTGHSKQTLAATDIGGSARGIAYRSLESKTAQEGIGG